MCPPPTGYDDTADAWVSSGALVTRINFAVALTRGQFRGIELASGPQHRRPRTRRTGFPEAVEATIMTTRRVFLKSTGMSLVTLGFAPSFLARTAEAAGTRRKLLIAIFQRGAVDGLNMIVPHGDAEYYRVRPTIAIARPVAGAGAAIDLDGYFGFHPRMSALTPLWHNHSLAIVHAAGSPDNTRSHFDAQDYMETATPGVKSTKDGWLNRYLQVAHEHGTPLTAIALARQMPRSLQGPAPALAMASVAEFGVRGTMGTQETFEEAYRRAADQVLKGTANDAFNAMRTCRLDRAPLGRIVRPTAQPTRGRPLARRCRRLRG